MIAAMTMRARALAAASWLDLVPSETRQSLYAAAMATAAFAVFFCVKLKLDFHCRVAMGAPIPIILSMKRAVLMAINT
jgi:hypothetical protein